MAKVIQLKSMNKTLRQLATQGKKGRDAAIKVKAAMAEAGDGEITTLQRTNHGENRIENAEKYDLGDGYRLVVQLVDGINKTRAFLFVGTHDETEEWLNNHKNYRWVKGKNDNVIDFIQVTEQPSQWVEFVYPNTTLPEKLISTPLLDNGHIEKIKVHIDNIALLDFISKITYEDWESNPHHIIEQVEELSTTELAIILNDIFSHAHKSEYRELSKRLDMLDGHAELANTEILTEAMLDTVNSEIFVTWEETDILPDDSSWSDWLLFLHPEQKAIANKEFKGPARLRGVSGSGKTCVMLHRARFLAKKYAEPILLVTLTESMRKLLESLIKDLCGVERVHIQTITINGLAEQIIGKIHPKGDSAYTKLSVDIEQEINRDIISFVKAHDAFSKSKLSKMNEQELKSFLLDEIFYIRSRLVPTKFDTYLDTKEFKRYGRKVGLDGSDRKLVLDATQYKIEKLKELLKMDYEGVTSASLSLLKNDEHSINSFGWTLPIMEDVIKNTKKFSPYRCVLVDEVQDLSQIEVEIISLLSTSNNKRISEEENGLFLVGDGAQTIYNKGFVLKSSGINVSNRSYVLQKNYRNSAEITNASYKLIEKYEFADIDEDNISKPTKPDMPNKRGEKPSIIKCTDKDSEANFTINKIINEIQKHQELTDTEEYPEICIIGLNKHYRETIKNKLNVLGIKCEDLKAFSNADRSDSVYISTIESAKGFEFRYVFIVGVMEGLLPKSNTNDENIAREASRLYVAMTRAQESLFITYNSQGTSSKFLNDIQEECDEFSYRDGIEKRM